MKVDDRGPLIEALDCADGARIGLHANGDRWSWWCTCKQWTHGNQQDVIRDADWHRTQHTAPAAS